MFRTLERDGAYGAVQNPWGDPANRVRWMARLPRVSWGDILETSKCSLVVQPLFHPKCFDNNESRWIEDSSQISTLNWRATSRLTSWTYEKFNSSPIKSGGYFKSSIWTPRLLSKWNALLDGSRNILRIWMLLLKHLNLPSRCSISSIGHIVADCRLW